MKMFFEELPAILVGLLLAAAVIAGPPVKEFLEPMIPVVLIVWFFSPVPVHRDVVVVCALMTLVIVLSLALKEVR